MTVMATREQWAVETSADFSKGQKVRWRSGAGEIRGTISDRFERKLSRRLTNGLVTRYGTLENPAYLIVLDNGSEALMLGSELTAV